nr:1-aminocyclopropane-1-carboxylate synthase 11-like [Ipomoea trifida]GLL39975.1 1-aminocyclopropane-1-carboxylate synthase 11-like [Ipomoea trifida]
MAYSGNPGKRPINFSNVGEDSQEIDQHQFVSTQESIGDANLPPIPPTDGGRKPTSWVWQHFEKTLVQGSSNRYLVSCKICATMKRSQKPFSWQSGTSGTGTLSRHLNSIHNIRNDEGQLERGQTQISGYASPGGVILGQLLKNILLFMHHKLLIPLLSVRKDWDAAEERTQDQLALMEDDDIDEWLAMDTSSETTPIASSRATSAGTSDQE